MQWIDGAVSKRGIGYKHKIENTVAERRCAERAPNIKESIRRHTSTKAEYSPRSLPIIE